MEPFTPLLAPAQKFDASTVDTSQGFQLAEGGALSVASPQALPEALPQQQPTLPHQDAVERFNTFVSQTEKQQSSPWPMIISLVALANGNAGPLFQLEEQKRKTAVFKQAQPILAETSRLANEGKWNEAAIFAQQAIGQFGARSPELGQFLSQLNTMYSSKHRAWEEAKTAYGLLKETTPKEHPNYGLIKSLGEAIKNRSPFSENLLNTILTRSAPQVLQSEGATRLVSPLTGEQKEIPQTSFARTEDFSDHAKRMLSAETGMPINQIINTMREPNNPDAIALGFRMSQLEGEAARFEIAKQVPLQPEIRTELGAMGYDVKQMASGDVPAAAWQKAAEKYASRVERQQAATLHAAGIIPSGLADRPFNVFDRETGQIRPDLTAMEALQNRERFSLLPPDRAGQGAFLYQLKNKLALMVPIVREMPNTQDPIGRVASFAALGLDRRFGIDPSTTAIVAMQTFAKDIIEQYANSKGIKASRFDFLTRPLTSDLASKESALQVLKAIETMVNQDIDVTISQTGKAGTGSVGPGIVPPPENEPDKQQKRRFKSDPGSAR